MAKIYVVSNGRSEAQAWAGKYGIPHNEVVYVESPNTFRGTSDPLVAFVGNYLNRNDLKEIQQMLRFVKTP